MAHGENRVRQADRTASGRVSMSIAPKMTGDAARVLIVDDSAVARSVLTRMIDGFAGFAVAGAVSHASKALAFLADNRVDIILLDLEMPGIDGLTALPDLLVASRRAKVLIVSSTARDGAAQTVQALALGAADTLVKPAAGSLAGRFEEALGEKLRRLIEPTAVASIPSSLPFSPQQVGAFDVIAIGASTGGIHALSQMLRQIPASVDEPMLITQHLPASFMSYFAAQVAVLAGRPCDVATDRMRIRRGRVIIAPGHAHMVCIKTADGAAIRLSEAPAVSGCLPSVDPMLESAGEVFGERALGVVLSGMGRDGARGAASLVERGGRMIAQDQDSSVIWGMPGAVVQGGLAKLVLPPDEIGRVIATRRRFG